jgi:hypothetical protein
MPRRKTGGKKKDNRYDGEFMEYLPQAAAAASPYISTYLPQAASYISGASAAASPYIAAAPSYITAAAASPYAIPVGAGVLGYTAYNSPTLASYGRKLGGYSSYLTPDAYNCPEGYNTKECYNYCKDNLGFRGQGELARCAGRYNGPNDKLEEIRQKAVDKLEKELEEAESRKDQMKIEEIKKKLEVRRKDKLTPSKGIRALLKAGAQYDRFVKAHRQVIKRAAIADRARNEGALYGNWAAESQAATLV